jgi:GH43 family beta-xylosidase
MDHAIGPICAAAALLLTAAVACSSPETTHGFGATDGSAEAHAEADGAVQTDATAASDSRDAPAATEAGSADAPKPQDAAKEAAPDVAAPCTTRIAYGSRWIHPDNHPSSWDEVSEKVTWDGSCVADGANSYAVLSNGWKPYFSGRGTCVLALDYDNCPGTAAGCATRIGYGPAWKAAPDHPQAFDDVASAVLWDGICRSSATESWANLSNGWVPHFSAANACDLSFRYTQCGGLYANPVIDADCPDPGVLRDGSQYYMACTSGNAGQAFPVRVSSDLVQWKAAGHVFPTGSKPSWAKGDFWAPELHRVGSGYVAYYTARHQDGALSIGAAKASQAAGPYVDIGQPLLHQSTMGLIDATYFKAPGGKQYLLWKEDGNAVGKPTPIHGQELAADGLSLVGVRQTLITNNLGWEGGVVEAPWMVEHGGTYYLFYSGNGYYGAAYAIGVAKAASPLGPYTKAGAPIVVTKGPWVGPGHNSVVTTPSGQDWLVYHAWKAGHVNGPGDGRVVLIDRLLWEGGWPSASHTPSSTSLPVP